jgi:hypothetical protein
MQDPVPQPILDSLFDTFEARKESRKSLLGFSLVYLTGYFTDPPATFHPELVHALESNTDHRLLIIGFRGSGKSTFGSLALPLWAALEYSSVPLVHGLRPKTAGQRAAGRGLVCLARNWSGFC